MWITLEGAHKVKTRKEHDCDGCGRIWPAGTLMETWTGIWLDEPPPMRCYLCLVCLRYWDELYACHGAWRYVPSDDSWLDGSLPDHDPKSYRKVEGKLALYVLAAGVTPIAAQPGYWESWR